MGRTTAHSLLFFVAFMAVSTGSHFNPAASARQAPEQAAAPAPNPADVASADSIIAAVYDVISGPTGKKRDWNRFRSLFAPGARLIPTFRQQDGSYSTRALTPEDYITRSGPLLEGEGFFEKEVARRTEQFGHIAQVFSTYEARRKADDSRPFMRGINSFQLMNDGKRWWIVTIFWEAEGQGVTIPDKYLK
jgi:hypothetical protein